MQKQPVFFVWALILGLTLWALIFCPAQIQARSSAKHKCQTLQIKGSDTMVNLGQAWAEEFMRLHPTVHLAVTGGGSGTGIAAILAGTCDIAQSSRDLSQEEQESAKAANKIIMETPVAWDGIAVVVHTANPVSELTVKQLADIFTGTIQNWNEIGGNDLPILVLSRERNSGTHVFFLEHVLRGGNAKGTEEFAQTALMMPSSQSIVQEVETSEAAIGYVGVGYVTNRIKTIRVARDHNGPYLLPTLDAIQAGEYPIARPLLFLTLGESQGDIKSFIDFVLSPAGQEIVKALDFVPLEK
ncbi:MAG: phosphate ABC transporter substrate-binding protein [Candidatus Omnitrophica bacterium]|nr:phosphate ABC transporter substrate-binding protein [Candidatus Omnitrophota bacterium]